MSRTKWFPPVTDVFCVPPPWSWRLAKCYISFFNATFSNMVLATYQVLYFLLQCYLFQHFPKIPGVLDSGLISRSCQETTPPRWWWVGRLQSKVWNQLSIATIDLTFWPIRPSGVVPVWSTVLKSGGTPLIISFTFMIFLVLNCVHDSIIIKRVFFLLV